MNSLLSSKKLLPLIIVILGGIAGYWIFESGAQKPKYNQKQKQKRVRTVQTIALDKGSVVPYWTASGFVISAESVNVSARVGGNIESINPLATPGALLKKGQWLVTLETIEYELALKSMQSHLNQAQANFELELADQVLAQEELKLLGNNDLGIEQSLVLREPQLTVAKAKVAVAQNNLERAQLNLTRTKVVMPFDGKLLSKNVGQGSKVSTNTTLFAVVNSDTYWLEVKIPHEFFNILDQHKQANISQLRVWGKGVERKANFISVLPELDTKDRQIKVLLAIDKPLAENTNQPSVFINDFLNVQLMGKPINNAWTINYTWLQPDNTIWVVDSNSTLQKRPVKILFKGRDLIYVETDIKQGDRALSEKPGIASVGLPVRTRQNLERTLAEDKAKGLLNKPSENLLSDRNNGERRQKGRKNET